MSNTNTDIVSAELARLRTACAALKAPREFYVAALDAHYRNPSPANHAALDAARLAWAAAFEFFIQPGA